MSKRKYTKKSDYWSKFNKAAASPQDLKSTLNSEEEWEPEFGGEPVYVAEAAYSRSSSDGATTSRRPKNLNIQI